MATFASKGKDGDALQVYQERDLSFSWVCHGYVGQHVRESLPVSMRS